MILNMADLVNSLKILQTLWNAFKTVLKWFVTASATVFFDLGGIRNCRKLADFEQMTWAIAHGFEHGQFFELLEIVPNSLKRLQNRSKLICDCFRDCLCRFRVNSQGSKIGRFWELLEIAPNSLKRLQNRSKMICECFRDCFFRIRGNSQLSKIGRFWAKDLGYSPWFWTWPIFWTAGYRSKLSETPPKPFWNDLPMLSRLFVSI